MAAPDLHRAPQPMTREAFEARLRMVFAGNPKAERAIARILADADAYAAHMIEQHARPPSRHFGPGGGWVA